MVVEKEELIMKKEIENKEILGDKRRRKIHHIEVKYERPLK